MEGGQREEEQGERQRREKDYPWHPLSRFGFRSFWCPLIMWEFKMGATPRECSGHAFQKNLSFIWKSPKWPEIYQFLLPRVNDNVNNKSKKLNLLRVYLKNSKRAKEDRDRRMNWEEMGNCSLSLETWHTWDFSLFCWRFPTFTSLHLKQTYCFLSFKARNPPVFLWSCCPVKQTRVHRKPEPANMQINNTPSQRTQVLTGSWPC